MDLALRPKTVARLMTVIVVCLVLNHIAIRLLEIAIGPEHDYRLFRAYTTMFTVNAEGVIPTMYSTTTLLFCSVLLTAIGLAERKEGHATDSFYWLGLGLVFLFLSMDEAFEIHERFSEPLRSALSTTGFFYNAWVIPYGILVVTFVSVYSKFLWRLPSRTRLLFVTAGAIYVTGAMGFELLGGRHTELHGSANLSYIFFSTAEEVFEMGGIVVFVYAILSHIGSHFSSFQIRISSE